MRIRNILGAALAGLALTTTSAEAQRLWGGQVQGGIPVPMSDFDNAVGSAFGWGFGARYAPPTGNFAIRFDIENSRFNIDNPDILDNAAWDADDGYARIWDFQLNGEFGMRNDAKFRLYGLAGIGYGNVYAAVTNGTLASGCYWDPWWGYICGTTSGDAVIAKRNQWEFSWNAGGGISMNAGRGARVFLEAVYTNIAGSSVSVGNETKDSKALTYMPIYLGVRF